MHPFVHSSVPAPKQFQRTTSPWASPYLYRASHPLRLAFALDRRRRHRRAHRRDLRRRQPYLGVAGVGLQVLGLAGAGERLVLFPETNIL